MWCSLLMHGVAFFDDRKQGEWVETESNQRNREKEREKIIKLLNASVTVTVHICTVSIVIVHKYTILHPLMWVFFWPKCVKWVIFSILQNFTQADGVALIWAWVLNFCTILLQYPLKFRNYYSKIVNTKKIILFTLSLLNIFFNVLYIILLCRYIILLRCIGK